MRSFSLVATVGFAAVWSVAVLRGPTIPCGSVAYATRSLDAAFARYVSDPRIAQEGARGLGPVAYGLAKAAVDEALTDRCVPRSAAVLQQMADHLWQTADGVLSRNGSVGIFLGAYADKVPGGTLPIDHVPPIALFGAYARRGGWRITNNYGDRTLYGIAGSDNTIAFNSGECAFWNATGRNNRIGVQTMFGGYHTVKEDGGVRVDGLTQRICLRCDAQR